MSYEAGITTAFLDDRVRFNLTGYYFDTKDLQLTAVGRTATVATLLNVDAKGHAIDAELPAAPARGRTCPVGRAWTVAEIDHAQPFVAGGASAPPRPIPHPTPN